MSRASCILLTYALLAVIALWVPINRVLIESVYLEANLLEGFQPRALIGTVTALLHLQGPLFLVVTQIALFLWLLAIAFLVAGPRRADGPAAPALYAAAIVFLFAFNTTAFITNALSGFVDIFSALLMVLCVWLLTGRYRSSSATLPCVVALLCTATLIHEKAIFGALVLLLWIAFTRDRKSALVSLAAYAGFAATYFYFVADRPGGVSNMTLREYLNLSTEFHSYLFENSANLIGIVFGGGVLWLLYARLAVSFVRSRRGQANGIPPLLVVLAMPMLCLAPLLVAWDTNRLVAIVWLPTLLLWRELELPNRWTRSATRDALLATGCLVQALIPPVLVYQHEAVPLNCYASAVVSGIERASNQLPDRTPALFTLGLNWERPDIAALYGCLPIHLTRP